MLALRRILCPTGFSSFAEGALEQAIAFGHRYEAGIVSVNAVPTLLPRVPVALPPQLEAGARQPLRLPAATPHVSVGGHRLPVALAGAGRQWGRGRR